MAGALLAHLSSGLTTVCQAWEVRRRDGRVFGFTDHDCDLVFGGVTFAADTGLSATALQQATGLSVDNGEALGALSAASVTEDDIAAGRFDEAEVVTWLVNWQNVAERDVVFRGHLGEIRRTGEAFEAELRGLTEALNRPIGRVFQKPCTAVLGDKDCGVSLATPGYAHEGFLAQGSDHRRLNLGVLGGFDVGWFQRGRMVVLDGAAAGLSAAVKRDSLEGGSRVLELWVPLRAAIAAGDRVRVEPGCDKRSETCRLKFDNLLNFRGYPDLPDEDWLMVHPTISGETDGGSRR